jgi:predicted TIM-barrel fold metal-dependent hydrolase
MPQSNCRKRAGTALYKRFEKFSELFKTFSAISQSAKARGSVFIDNATRLGS